MYFTTKNVKYIISDELDVEYVHKVLRVLQVSEAPSIRIHWLRLRLASLFCARILFSRYIKHFDFGLTCDVTGDTEVI